MKHDPDVYLDDRYAGLIGALVDVTPCPITGERTADQIQQVFCKFNSWPKSIRADVIRATRYGADGLRPATGFPSSLA
jgi:hypothetical protein